MKRASSCQVVLDLLNPAEGERVLDLGCGTGELARLLVDRGCRVTALDWDPVVLEQARLAAPEAEVLCADAWTFAPAEPFDALAAMGVLQWMEPFQEAVRVLAGFLRRGGRAAGVCGGSGAAVVEAATLRSALRQSGFLEVEVEQHEDRVWFYAVRGER